MQSPSTEPNAWASPLPTTATTIYCAITLARRDRSVGSQALEVINRQPYAGKPLSETPCPSDRQAPGPEREEGELLVSFPTLTGRWFLSLRPMCNGQSMKCPLPSGCARCKSPCANRPPAVEQGFSGEERKRRKNLWSSTGDAENTTP